jgi:hypothetical protein
MIYEESNYKDLPKSRAPVRNLQQSLGIILLGDMSVLRSSQDIDIISSILSH